MGSLNNPGNVTTGSSGPTAPVVVTAASQQMAPNIRYIANRSAGIVTFLLPAIADLKMGDQCFVRGGKDGTGWKVTQNAGQMIKGNSNTTAGTSGYLQSQTITDTVALEVTAIDQQAGTCEMTIISNRGTVDIA